MHRLIVPFIRRNASEDSRFILFAVITFALLTLSSCATMPGAPGMPPAPVTPQLPAPPIRNDITHTVAPGETIWRISKMYDVRPKDILLANALRSASDLKLGQPLLIPNAAPVKPVINLYQSDKWRYIIIHHSATDNGNALYFDYAHRKRGFNRGLGYHFVIDNGTDTKADGQIEVSPRWIKQQNGAHCSASGMNFKSIGICLVGNFNYERVSGKQMNSLVYLVKLLRKYYGIPANNILGHGQVKNAQTDCPGRNFPWNEFRSRMRHSGG